MDAIAPGLCADIYHRISGAAGLGVKNLVLDEQSERERVHQRISAITGFELRFAAEVRHAETVSVGGDATNDAFDDRVVFGDASFGVDVRLFGVIGPKRSESITAMGRAPMVKMSRRMPPTPVAAP